MAQGNQPNKHETIRYIHYNPQSLQHCGSRWHVNTNANANSHIGGLAIHISTSRILMFAFCVFMFCFLFVLFSCLLSFFLLFFVLFVMLFVVVLGVLFVCCCLNQLFVYIVSLYVR